MFTGESLRGLIYQLAAAAILVLAVWFALANASANLSRTNIATGWTFLAEESGFQVGESLIAQSPTSSYAYTLLAGVVNTLFVSAIGIVLASFLGLVVGIGRLSGNWLIARYASAYVEVFRNTPILLQIIVWYTVLRGLPGTRQALNPLPGVFLSNRGLRVPAPLAEAAHPWMGLAFLVGLALALLWARFVRRRQARTGQRLPGFLPGLAMALGFPALVWLVAGAPFRLDMPVLRGFNFRGGADLSPEFVALLAGLVAYTGAFIAEIVRAGIQSVPRGQIEAARAVGLHPGAIMRLVVLPQALRVIVPPLASQYLGLCKNSSLAVAIGYPDVVNVMQTTINQTGQAIEGLAVIMAVYLTISLSIAAFMNWYNRRVAIVER
ncbi:MAG: ABC transporter permease subunit [Alphaproteobacteria bacterium]|nr:ABC transporter permease subunit [Alphaproteobacteria bacterium]